jgi:hypothetical protein
VPNTNNGATNIYMMKSEAHLQTRAHNYGMPESVEKGKEASNPLPPLQIEKTMGETMTHIPKGAFKKDSHNPKCKGFSELLHHGGSGTNSLCNVCSGSPPEFPLTEESIVVFLGSGRDY